MSNNDSYAGQFKDGHMNGKGEYCYANGQRAYGYFVNGRMISEKNKPRNFARSRLSNNLFEIQENLTGEEQQAMEYS